MNKNTLVRNAIYNIIYRVLGIIFPIITASYIARVLLPDGVGRINAVQNNVSYFIMIISIGIQTYGIREIAKCKTSLSERSTVFFELFCINGCLSVLSGMLFIVLVFCAPIFREETRLYLICGLAIAANIINIEWLFQGVEEYKFITVRSFWIKFIALIMTIFFVKNKQDIYKYALIQTFSSCGNFFWGFSKINKYIVLNVKGCNYRRHIKPLLFLSICFFSTEIYSRIDITMLGIISDNTSVGYYTSAQRIVSIIMTLIVSITNVFLPRLSELINTNKNKFKELVEVGTNIMIMLSIPLSMCLVFIGKNAILVLFGDEFARATISLQLLALIIPLRCVVDIAGYQVMICAGKEKKLAKIYFAIMISNIIINSILIPRMNEVGASISTIVTEFFAFLIVYYSAKKIIEIRISYYDLLKTIMVTVVLCCTICLLNALAQNIYLSLLLDIVICGIIFVLLNLILRNKVFSGTLVQFLNLFKKS
ncbi:flippase [Butyrivibrio fibrisolvens]|uniref:flippase n=1 Tax=Butyrivibrio fibrisolvens TaxID=831 RepID=UPI0003B41FAA|nr:flippase [Butyrivibrio fibrisolvens]